MILNESDGDIVLPPDICDPQRFLGGANTPRDRDILTRKRVHRAPQAAWRRVGGKVTEVPALMDFETDERILHSGNKGERYGPVFAPYHDYRILYAHGEK